MLDQNYVVLGKHDDREIRRYHSAVASYWVLVGQESDPAYIVRVGSDQRLLPNGLRAYPVKTWKIVDRTSSFVQTVLFSHILPEYKSLIVEDDRQHMWMNAVVHALACGLVVQAFDTKALVPVTGVGSFPPNSWPVISSLS